MDCFDENDVILIENAAQTNNVYVIFTGFGVFQKTIFEYRHIFQSISGTKIFIRDPYTKWFQAGISDKINTFEKLVGFVKNKIVGYKERVFIGSSGGGMAALGVGCLCNATAVHAFAPQTFIDKKTNNIYKDERWAIKWERIHEEKFPEKYFNLINYMPQEVVGNYNVYYCGGCSNDYYHIDNLLSVGGIIFREFNCFNHNIAFRLKSKQAIYSYILCSKDVKDHDCRLKVVKYIS